MAGEDVRGCAEHCCTPVFRDLETLMTRLLSLLLAVVIAGQAPFGRIAAQGAGPTKDRANSYDDEWQSNWIEHGKGLLGSAQGKRPGFVLHIGDSITYARPYSEWAVTGAGKTVEDAQITEWSQPTAWGTTDPDGSIKNGWFLAGLGITARRSMTAASGLTLSEFISGSGNGDIPMPAVTDTPTARQVIADPAYYGDLQVDTLCAAFPDAQVAVVMLGTNDPANPDNIVNLTTVIDKLEARNILPVLSTIPPQSDPVLAAAVIQLNGAIVSLARARALPLIDFYQEVLLRRPGGSWLDTLISSDGVHPTAAGGVFYSGSDPYVPGGDPSVHLTGDAASNVGYLLRGWLTVQKLKEIKSAVLDDVGALPAPVITSPSAAAGAVGAPFSYQMAATNSPTSFSADPLPAGLTIGAGTGLITGTPATAGTFVIALGATNSSGTGNQLLTLTIRAAAAAPAITSPLAAAGRVGVPFTYQITASNRPSLFGATGLPPGLSVAPKTGRISGKPTLAGTFDVTIRATNSTGTGTAALILTIARKSSH
jgi:hypothetical protein